MLFFRIKIDSNAETLEFNCKDGSALALASAAVRGCEGRLRGGMKANVSSHRSGSDFSSAIKLA